MMNHNRYSSLDDLTTGTSFSMEKRSRTSGEVTLDQASTDNVIVPTANNPLSRDGDALAWLQCFNAFLLMFNSWGLVNSFGVFQTYYMIEELRFENSSNLSWIGSLQTFLLMFAGIATGPLFDKGYLRIIVCTGGILVVLGMMLTSICHEYWQFVLAQGLLVGLGFGCLFTPSVAIVPRYFERQRSLALGIAATGSSLGGVIFPIMFNQLLPKVGFGWTCRILAFTTLATMILPMTTLRWRGEKTPSKKGFDASAWKEVSYVLFAVCSFFGFLGIYIPFYYVEFFALEKNLVNLELLGYIVSFLNAGSFFGRLIPPYLADKYNTLTVTTICAFCLAVIGICWIALVNEGSLIAFCIIFGFFSGAFVALGPAVVASLTTDMRYFGVRVGMLLVPASIGTLIGNPIAGATLGKSWLALQLFCGIVLILAFMLSLGAKVWLLVTRTRVLR